jgi:hypothetical protein
MKTSVLVLALAFVWSANAAAATITWEDAGFIQGVSNGTHLPGLTVGTPWSLQVSFDPLGTPTSLASPGSGCDSSNNFYSTGSTTFTLGAFTYQSAGGRVFTNSGLPYTACAGHTGMVQFDWGAHWTQEPGAWNLNQFGGVLIAGYYDANHSDGSLPTAPVPNAFQGNFTGLFFNDVSGFNAFQFYSSFSPSLQQPAQPAPVPEPATMSLMGVSLAVGASFRRCRQRRSV